MSQPRILVTTARGKTGYAVAKACLDLGLNVRALVGQVDHTAQDLKARGAEIVLGRLDDIRDMRRAMQGVQRAYFCVPFAPHGLHKSTVFTVAAAEARLEHTVVLSQWLSSESHPSLITREQWLMDQTFGVVSNLSHTILNPGFFADNYFLVLEPMAQLGMMPMPLGEGRNVPPSNEDMGRVAAHILCDPSGHEGQTYRPTGPRIVTPQEVADAVGRAAGRKVRFMDIPDWMMLKAVRAGGFPIFQYNELMYYMEEYRQDAFAVGGPTNVVRDITDREPEDMETIARRYIAERPEGKRSARNLARAMANFAKLIVTPTPNLKRYERQQYRPVLTDPGLCQDDPKWARTHAVVTASPNQHATIAAA